MKAQHPFANMTNFRTAAACAETTARDAVTSVANKSRSYLAAFVSLP